MLATKARAIKLDIYPRRETYGFSRSPNTGKNAQFSTQDFLCLIIGFWNIYKTRKTLHGNSTDFVWIFDSDFRYPRNNHVWLYVQTHINYLSFFCMRIWLIWVLWSTAFLYSYCKDSVHVTQTSVSNINCRAMMESTPCTSAILVVDLRYSFIAQRINPLTPE